jgi:hypothetical protein
VYGELPLIKTTTGTEIAAIPIVIQNPRKVAALRLPTSEEISAYTATIKQVINRLGRRQSEDRDVPNQPAERRLFEAMRLDPTGDEFDDAEMRHAIELVLRHSVSDCTRDGDLYIVKVSTLWGATVHSCRVPTTKELQTYRDGVIKSRELPHGMEERRFPPDEFLQLHHRLGRWICAAVQRAGRHGQRRPAFDRRPGTEGLPAADPAPSQAHGGGRGFIPAI